MASNRRTTAERNLALIEQRAMQVQADLEEALNRLSATEHEPEEPRKGSIIRYNVQYQDDGVVYTYVAFHAPIGLWYRTGHKEGVNWATLLDYMYRDVTSKRLGVGFYLYSGKNGKWVGRVGA